MNDIGTIGTAPTLPANADTLPHNIEAEQQLLGAILTNNDLYDRIAAIVRAEHFFEPVHQRIFEVAVARIQKNALASPVTLKAFLEDDPGLKELGGPAYLARLAGAAIAAYAARDYAQMIYELAVRRELIRLGAEIRVDGNHAVVGGGRSLTGAIVQCPDLRAGAALAIAGLAAEGTTELRDAYHIDRGYERFEEKLQAVGADIRRTMSSEGGLCS